MKNESTVTVVEERCDRCNALFSVYHLNGKTRKKVKESTRSAGPFRMIIGSDELSYESVCEACANRARTMMIKMGKVDRTRGRGRKKK